MSAAKQKPMRGWLVWETEYPEDGSYEVRARTHWEAKRRYIVDACGGDLNDANAPLTARLLTPELRRERKKRGLDGQP